MILFCAECPCAPPDGAINIVDCLAVVDRFVNASCAPLKVRVDLEPGAPDRQINISDLAACLFNAFLGIEYDLSQPERCK